MYTLKFQGKTHQISGAVFCIIALPIIALFVALAGWCGYMGYQASIMIEHYTNIPAVIAGIIAAILLISVTLTLNGVESKKAVLPPIARTCLGIMLTLATLNYHYTVKEWSVAEIAILASPLLLLLVCKLMKK